MTMTMEPICQVQYIGEDRLTCPVRESGGYRCERTDPHGEGHRIGPHTIEHDRRGNGFVCDGERIIGFRIFGGL
jgi:hypothetical protein